jgi:hypothetical protein
MGIGFDSIAVFLGNIRGLGENEENEPNVQNIYERFLTYLGRRETIDIR